MTSSSIIKLPASAAQFSPLSLARMLWLHKGAILLIWLVASGITVGVVYMLPAVYSADVEILVYPQQVPEKMVPSVVNTSIQDRLATIQAEILGGAQLQKVIDDFGLYKKERKTQIPEEILQTMRAAITLKLEKGWTNNQTGAFRVAYSGEDPAIVTQVANRVGNLFIEDNQRTRLTQVEGTKEFLDSLLDDAKKRLDESEAAISAYKMRHNGELPEQVVGIAGNVGRLQVEENANRDAIARDEDSKMTIQNTLELASSNLQSLLNRPETPATVAARPEEPAAPVKQTHVAKQSEVLESQLAGLRGRGLGEQHPEVKRLKVAIDEAKSDEAKAEQEAAKAPPAPAPVPAPVAPTVAVAPPPPAAAEERSDVLAARERVRTMQTQIESIDKDIAARTANQDRLAKAVEEAQARLTNVPVREQEIALILRDHNNIEGEYQALLAKSSTVKVSSDMEFRQKSEHFAINDLARVPGKPISPDRVLFNLLGSVVGLGLGCVFALGKELHEGRLLGSWELPDEVLVLAHVPRISPARGLPIQGFWARWSRTRRVAVVSCVLLPVLGLVAAARVYLVH
jgi:succinoglycan biosynthesis transport protein ExoP